MKEEQYDKLIIRCPTLGGEVPFLYCRKSNQSLPCNKLPLCWGYQMDIIGYINSFYSKEEIGRYFLQRGTSRLTHIINQIERAKHMEAKDKDKDKNQDRNKEALIDAIKREVKEGKITCARAWLLAQEYNYPKLKTGELLDELGIKIVKCQLGCF